jgi:hypothetical protein
LNLLEEIKADHDLCINNPHEYQQKVDSISNLFSLRGRQRLKGDNCPVYVVGKYQSTPFVMFGINPGYSPINNPQEEIEARKSWEHYQKLYLNFFLFFDKHEFESPYYTSLWQLLSGLTEEQKKSKWELFDSYLTNLELIPYHSQGITLPNKFTTRQLDYLTSRLTNNLNFITAFKPKLFIFNGSAWHILLIKHDLVKEYQNVPISKLFNIYFFEIQGVPSVLFDKFFSRHYWGINDYDRKVTLPRLIRAKYKSLQSIC